MVHVGCVFVAAIHPSRTWWMSESFESVRWNVCVHRLGLGVYSHLKEFCWNGVRTHANSKGKIPSTRKILPRGGSNLQRCIKQDSKPNALSMSYSRPSWLFEIYVLSSVKFEIFKACIFHCIWYLLENLMWLPSLNFLVDTCSVLIVMWTYSFHMILFHLD